MPWVYHHERDHDRQAAEDNKAGTLWHYSPGRSSQAFFIGVTSPDRRKSQRPEGIRSFGENVILGLLRSANEIAGLLSQPIYPQRSTSRGLTHGYLVNQPVILW